MFAHHGDIVEHELVGVSEAELVLLFKHNGVRTDNLDFGIIEALRNTSKVLALLLVGEFFSHLKV